MRRDPCTHEGVSRRGFLNLTCLFFVLVAGLAEATFSSPASAQTIIDEWAAVKVPPPPELKPVTIDPKVTALLVMDIVRQTCPPRPRCVASVPKIQGLLTQARGKGMAVIYSLVSGGSVADILSGVAPQGGEPIVTSGPDKFLGTDLERVLRDRGVQAVIIVGTAANGVVIYTGSGAALRGLKVIIPVDGMSAADPYVEQYTAWHLVNAPRVGLQVTLTRVDMIRFP